MLLLLHWQKVEMNLTKAVHKGTAQAAYICISDDQSICSNVHGRWMADSGTRGMAVYTELIGMYTIDP